MTAACQCLNLTLALLCSILAAALLLSTPAAAQTPDPQLQDPTPPSLVDGSFKLVKPTTGYRLRARNGSTAPTPGPHYLIITTIPPLAVNEVDNARRCAPCALWSVFVTQLPAPGYHPKRETARAEGITLNLYGMKSQYSFSQWCPFINASTLASGGETRLVALDNRAGHALLVQFWAKRVTKFVSAEIAEAELIRAAEQCAQRGLPFNTAKPWAECVKAVAIDKTGAGAKLTYITVCTEEASTSTSIIADPALPVVSKKLTLTSGGQTGTLLFVGSPGTV